ncbi:uncharacterized protein EAE97_001472 [Botrytis byssoidea]|uniref:Uncharacterized protein n=1 Tax=Botrytis byssoidea TaxID=139641 RepID=A0A9P5LXZ8_9HELO|nr:uncharacterized protein EAE97_001472 [Botrytis byssoidea]KAF7951975.1 hypothetical protein EAE97_001472 [Botrytis byssoidea]
MSSSTEIQPPWLTFFTKQASIPSGQEFVPKISNIFIDFLLSENDDAAAKAAKQIDDSTRDSLNFVFQTIYDLAAFIPYEDRKQDMLLQLIVELLKLPRKTFEGADDKVSKDLLSPNEMHTDLMSDRLSSKVLQVKHDMWNARKSTAIISLIYIDTDFRIVVATRYIIIAGEKIREDGVQWWDEHVPIWERKLQEFENCYENGFPEVTLRFETPPGEKDLIGTGDLGMDVLASVKAAREKLKDMREGVLEQESNEDLAGKKDE